MLIDPSVWQSTFIPADVLAKVADDCFLRQLVVCRAGYYPRARGHFIERPGIDEHILIHCLAGAGWVEVEGRRSPVGPGGLALCPSGLAHAYGAEAIEPWTIRWAHFKGEGCAELLGRLGFSPAAPVRQVGLPAAAVAALRDCCRILGAGYSYPLLLQASLALAAFLAALMARDAGPSPDDAGRAAGRGGFDAGAVIRLMLDRLDEALSLDSLAELAGYSRYHFCRAFRERTGYPPMEYFARLKIQRACELLETTAQSGREISEALGYATPFYFSAVFKRITGQSPTEYRDLHLERAAYLAPMET